MIADRDYYADKHDKLTDDPDKYAFQVAAKGCFLDDRIAKRYGITAETSAPVVEPKAKGQRPAPLSLSKQTEEKSAEPPPAVTEPETDEPEAKEPKAAASQKTVAKAEGAKKK